MAKEESNVVESGVDTSRPATDLPDRMMIGGGRDPKPRQKEPVEVDEVDDVDEVDTEVESEEEVSDQVIGDDDGDTDSSQVGETETDSSEDDDIIDVLLSGGLSVESVEKATGKEIKAEDVLEGHYKEEYDSAAEAYGTELADKLLKNRLLREQRLEKTIKPLLEERERMREAEAQKVGERVSQFFATKASGGFSSVYGPSPDKAKPIQVEAMKRVVQKALEIKTKVEAAGFQMTPEKALEKAHQQIWGNTEIGKRVQSSQSTMQKRSQNISLPTTRGGMKNGGGRSTSDPYAKVRASLKKAGYADR